MSHAQFSRGQLAKASGVNAETIRYYETAGLLADPPRSAGGHRIYDDSHVKRLAFIRRCRELGFNVSQVRDLLSLVDGETVTCNEVMTRTQAHLVEIRSKIQDLENMQQALTDMVRHCSGQDVPDCPIIDRLWDG